MRLRRTLSDGWEFTPDRSASARIEANDPQAPQNNWRPIQVPGYWQMQFRDLARATGPGWYRVVLELEPSWLEFAALSLEFGAVSHFCQGWLNGHYLGEHEGGHLPFSWSLNGAARAGNNELLIRVVSPSGDRTRYRDFPFEEILHGKQSWYGPAGGIWQEVSIEARSDDAVDAIDVRPDPNTGQVVVRVGFSGDPTALLRVEILGPDGDELVCDTITPDAPVTLWLSNYGLQWWSPESPSLYVVRVTVLVDGHETDVAEKRFGFRTFVADNGRFVLNGEPFSMRGVLDQDYYDSPGVPTSKQALLDRFAVVKAMGFNTIRCHIKIPDPWYLDAADEIGLLLWCELPSTSRLTTRARDRVEETLTAMIERDRHHPSVVVWSIANEAWGYDLVGNSEHRAWLSDLYRRTKAQVHDRLIVDNSPCLPNFHIETDVEDFHFYAVIPEMRQRWDDFLEAFSNRADFTFSPNGDARRSGTEPLVVSEFGAWGLPDLSLVDGDEPWWFESGQEWADGAAYVHGAQERYALWHLDRVFGSWDGLCRATHQRQFETMKYQIETMRLRPEIAGYVLTELSDVHWEANGLLDMFGNPRSFAARLSELNASPTVIAKIDRVAVWQDETTRAEFTIVNDNQKRPDVEVRCGIVGHHESWTEARVTLGPEEHYRLAPFEVPGHGGDTPSPLTVQCSLFSNTERVATTDQTVLVVPRLGPQLDPDKVLVVRDDDLAARLDSMGYKVADRSSGSSLRVMRCLSSDDHGFIEAGGRGLLLAEDVDALGSGFGEFPAIELKPWREALFGGGEWVSAFSWLRRSERFADLPGGPLMDAIFEGLTPNVVITGIPPARFEYDVLAGVFVGWVHQVAALIARHNAGLGSLTISTLKLTEQPPGADPLASWLLHQLIAGAWTHQ